MNVREIKLPCGKVALVSEEDWSRVGPINWSDNGLGYVRGRWRMDLGGTGKIVFLHRFIMKPPPGMVVDHIDCNPLNNTRDNLQITTIARNVMRSRTGGVTRISGRPNKSWRARLRVDGRMVSLGVFATREEAEARIASAQHLIWNTAEFNPLGTVR
jgi:hypothetical protein